MSDLIYRQDAIEGICKEWCGCDEDRIKRCNADPHRGEYDSDKFHCDGCDDVVVIRELPSAQPEPQWIPCSERLPEDGERVLATHLGGINPDRQVIEHIYTNGKFTMGWDMDMNVGSPTFGQRYMGEIIAWMPLPEPWKGDAE